MKNFEGFGLHPALMQSLETMKYDVPTPIQAQAIPPALQGRDIMGTAQTGTGKTAAFAIPLVNALLDSEDGAALVLTPTRELGKQVLDIMRQLLGPKSGIRTAFLIGGESIMKQRSQIKNNPRLIVGTPGRINDHLRNRALKLDNTRFLVLDETDRMLDMGFSVQIDEILKHVPEERQTLLFSATLPKNILQLSSKYLEDPVRVAVGSTEAPAKNIKQEVVFIDDASKYEKLVAQLHERNGSVIIFVKTKHNTEKIAKKLSREGFEADAIHGDLKQRQRDRVIREFRDMNFRILVATDVAARGLDIPHIEHVINYDLPQVAEDYIHRIGRTARAGAEGSALCLISNNDKGKWRMIEELMNPDMKRERPAGARSAKPQRGRNRGGERDRKFGKDRKAGSGQGRKFEDRAPRQDGEYRKPKFGEKKPYSDRAEKPRGDFKTAFTGEKREQSNRDWKKKPDGKRNFEGKRDYSGGRSQNAPSEWKAKPRPEYGEGRKFSEEKPQKPREDRKFADGSQKPRGEWAKKPDGGRKFEKDRPRKFNKERPQAGGDGKPARKLDGDQPPKRKFDADRRGKPDGTLGDNRTRKPKGEWKKKSSGPQKKRHTIADMKRAKKT